MLAGPTSRSFSATSRASSISCASRVVIPLVDPPPLALRLEHRSRDRVQAAAVEIAEDIDRELLAGEAGLHDRLDRRVAEEEVELRAVLGAIDVARAEGDARPDEPAVAA